MLIYSDILPSTACPYCFSLRCFPDSAVPRLVNPKSKKSSAIPTTQKNLRNYMAFTCKACTKTSLMSGFEKKKRERTESLADTSKKATKFHANTSPRTQSNVQNKPGAGKFVTQNRGKQNQQRFPQQKQPHQQEKKRNDRGTSLTKMLQKQEQNKKEGFNFLNVFK